MGIPPISSNIDSLIRKQQTISVRTLLLKQGRQFEIPFNQRPWMWKDANLRDLWADILKGKDSYFDVKSNGKLKQRPKPLRNPHFFGAFLFYERASGTYEVVDGQQRLTSISMLMAIFREIARGIAQGENSRSLRQEAENLETSLTNWLLTSSNPPVPRLRLDHQFDQLFRAYVIDPRTAEDRSDAYKELSDSVRRRKGSIHLKGGFDALRTHVRQGLAGLSDAQLVDWIGKLESVVADGFIGSRIVVLDEPFAFSVFGTLNARGVSLSPADMIKNELFERAQKSEHEQIKQDWDAIYDHVPEGNVELFLRLRHLAFVNPDCPRRQLFKNVKARELKDELPVSVTTRWRKDAELLACLVGEKSHPKIKGELKRHLNTLHTQLKIQYSWPLLLSSARRYLDADVDTFRKLTRLTLAFCFRVLTIGEADVSELERPVAQAAFKLTEGAEPREIAGDLRKENSDEEFKEDFASAALHRAATQFYALYELEVHRGKQGGLSIEPFPHSPRQNVEHILPQRLSMAEARLDEWAEWRYLDDDTATEEHGEYVNRLGNLLILEGEINSQVSNYDFEAKRTGSYPGPGATYKGQKRKSFVDSKLSLVKDLLDPVAYPEWTEAEIEKRQAEMAAEAVNAWTLNFVDRGS